MNDKTKIGELAALLLNFDAMSGRTVASVHSEFTGHNTYLVFRFTDGAGALMREHDGEYSSYYTDELETRLSDHDNAFFGLITMEDYQRNEAARDAQYRAAAEDRERLEFERLKAKFNS